MIKETVIDNYEKYLINEFKQIHSKYTADKSIDLVFSKDFIWTIGNEEASALSDLLKKNWELIRGTCLSYTALPRGSITLFCCQVAEALARFDQEKYGSAIEALMPGIIIEPIDPQLRPLNQISLEKLLATHVEGQIVEHDGQRFGYLVPMEQFLNLRDKPALQRFNGYYDIETQPPALTYIADEVIERMYHHSPDTLALQQAEKIYKDLLKKDNSLFFHLQKLCDGLYLYGVNGKGTEEDASVEAYTLIREFYQFYHLLDQKKMDDLITSEEEKRNFTNLKQEIDYLYQLVHDSEANKKAGIQTCINTRRQALKTWIVKQEKILEKIGLSDQVLDDKVVQARFKIQQAKEIFLANLQLEVQLGADKLPLNMQIIQLFYPKMNTFAVEDLFDVIDMPFESLAQLVKAPVVQTTISTFGKNFYHLAQLIFDHPIHQLKNFFSLIPSLLQPLEQFNNFIFLVSMLDEEKLRQFLTTCQPTVSQWKKLETFCGLLREVPSSAGIHLFKYIQPDLVNVEDFLLLAQYWSRPCIDLIRAIGPLWSSLFSQSQMSIGWHIKYFNEEESKELYQHIKYQFHLFCSPLTGIYEFNNGDDFYKKFKTAILTDLRTENTQEEFKRILNALPKGFKKIFFQDSKSFWLQHGLDVDDLMTVLRSLSRQAQDGLLADKEIFTLPIYSSFSIKNLCEFMSYIPPSGVYPTMDAEFIKKMVRQTSCWQDVALVIVQFPKIRADYLRELSGVKFSFPLDNDDLMRLILNFEADEISQLFGLHLKQQLSTQALKDFIASHPHCSTRLYERFKQPLHQLVNSGTDFAELYPCFADLEKLDVFADFLSHWRSFIHNATDLALVIGCLKEGDCQRLLNEIGDEVRQLVTDEQEFSLVYGSLSGDNSNLFCERFKNHWPQLFKQGAAEGFYNLTLAQWQSLLLLTKNVIFNNSQLKNLTDLLVVVKDTPALFDYLLVQLTPHLEKKLNTPIQYADFFASFAEPIKSKIYEHFFTSHPDKIRNIIQTQDDSVLTFIWSLPIAIFQQLIQQYSDLIYIRINQFSHFYHLLSRLGVVALGNKHIQDNLTSLISTLDQCYTIRINLPIVWSAIISTRCSVLTGLINNRQDFAQITRGKLVNESLYYLDELANQKSIRFKFLLQIKDKIPAIVRSLKDFEIIMSYYQSKDFDATRNDIYAMMILYWAEIVDSFDDIDKVVHFYRGNMPRALVDSILKKNNSFLNATANRLAFLFMALNNTDSAEDLIYYCSLLKNSDHLELATLGQYYVQFVVRSGIPDPFIPLNEQQRANHFLVHFSPFMKEQVGNNLEELLNLIRLGNNLAEKKYIIFTLKEVIPRCITTSQDVKKLFQSDLESVLEDITREINSRLLFNAELLKDVNFAGRTALYALDNVFYRYLDASKIGASSSIEDKIVLGALEQRLRQEYQNLKNILMHQQSTDSLKEQHHHLNIFINTAQREIMKTQRIIGCHPLLIQLLEHLVQFLLILGTAGIWAGYNKQIHGHWTCHLFKTKQAQRLDLLLDELTALPTMML